MATLDTLPKRYCGLKAAHEVKDYPIGAERYRNKAIEVKTPDGWKLKSIYIWEQANGKLPDGHRIMFADQNKSNFELDNLLAVTLREIFYMNRRGLITTCKELTKVGLAHARHSMTLLDRIQSLTETTGDSSDNSKYRNKKRTGHYTLKQRAKIIKLSQEKTPCKNKQNMAKMGIK